MRIGIIGTAFRKEDAPKLTRELFNKATEAVRKEISSRQIKEDITLVSGGAAGIDSIACRLYFSHHCNIELHFPSQFDAKNCRFYGNKDAETANYYHQRFSDKLGYNSLEDIRELHRNQHRDEIQLFYYDGFLQRNLEVGKVDILIALTFNNDTIPKDGGTKHTWNHSPAPLKIHINLDSLQV